MSKPNKTLSQPRQLFCCCFLFCPCAFIYRKYCVSSMYNLPLKHIFNSTRLINRSFGSFATSTCSLYNYKTLGWEIGMLRGSGMLQDLSLRWVAEGFSALQQPLDENNTFYWNGHFIIHYRSTKTRIDNTHNGSHFIARNGNKFGINVARLNKWLCIDCLAT